MTIVYNFNILKTDTLFVGLFGCFLTSTTGFSTYMIFVVVVVVDVDVVTFVCTQVCSLSGRTSWSPHRTGLRRSLRAGSKPST